MPMPILFCFFFFFFKDTATTEIYTLSLHDALPISPRSCPCTSTSGPRTGREGPEQGRQGGGRLDEMGDPRRLEAPPAAVAPRDPDRPGPRGLPREDVVLRVPDDRARVDRDPQDVRRSEAPIRGGLLPRDLVPADDGPEAVEEVGEAEGLPACGARLVAHRGDGPWPQGREHLGDPWEGPHPAGEDRHLLLDEGGRDPRDVRRGDVEPLREDPVEGDPHPRGDRVQGGRGPARAGEGRVEGAGPLLPRVEEGPVDVEQDAAQGAHVTPPQGDARGRPRRGGGSRSPSPAPPAPSSARPSGRARRRGAARASRPAPTRGPPPRQAGPPAAIPGSASTIPGAMTSAPLYTKGTAPMSTVTARRFAGRARRARTVGATASPSGGAGGGSPRGRGLHSPAPPPP